MNKWVNEFSSVQQIFHGRSYCPRHCGLNGECADEEGTALTLNELVLLADTNICKEMFQYNVENSMGYTRFCDSKMEEGSNLY